MTNQHIIKRNAAPTLLEAAKGFPVLAINGPRQSGKTTLVRACFPKKPYASLEDIDQRKFATEDPRGFLSQFPDGAILDEVQRCPDLFSYLQTFVDEDKRPGLFILTGSQQFGLLSGIGQSLAGRVFLLTLLPFSLDEVKSSRQAPKSLPSLIFQGLYPPLYDRQLKPSTWYQSYISTYLERDVRQLINVRDLSNFQQFLHMCAGYTGQLLNLSSLARDCGIDHTTAKAWLSVLEASYLIYLLRPHFNNFNKRLIKSPKLYFLDTGLAARLLELQTPEQLAIHPHRGALFETWVVGEILKMRFNRGLSSNLYFWRDRSGHEVDLLIEHATKLIPIEAKSGQTINADFFKGISQWLNLAGDRTDASYVVYGGKKKQIRHGITALPWDQIGLLESTVI